MVEGTFREDLMFRINTFEVHVPSLRERTEDIEPLAIHLLRRHRVDATAETSFTEAAMDRLRDHSWPGNVRELANVIEHAAILCESFPIDESDLPQHFGRRSLRKELLDDVPKTLRELEMMAIEQSLARHSGNKAGRRRRTGRQPENALQPFERRGREEGGGVAKMRVIANV